MTELVKVCKPALERVGLNSLRDFFLDHWSGLILEKNTDAEAFLKNFIEMNSEEKILSRLSRGKIFLFFITDSNHRYILKTQPAEDAGYEFKLVGVDGDVSLVYLRAKKNEDKFLSYISAELTGHYRMLKKINFDKKHIKRWMNCRISDKIICIEEIKMILANESLLEAFSNYNPYFTSKEYYLWRKKYGIDFPIRKDFRKLLSDIVRRISK